MILIVAPDGAAIRSGVKPAMSVPDAMQRGGHSPPRVTVRPLNRDRIGHGAPRRVPVVAVLTPDQMVAAADETLAPRGAVLIPALAVAGADPTPAPGAVALIRGRIGHAGPSPDLAGGARTPAPTGRAARAE